MTIDNSISEKSTTSNKDLIEKAMEAVIVKQKAEELVKRSCCCGCPLLKFIQENL